MHEIAQIPNHTGGIIITSHGYRKIRQGDIQGVIRAWNAQGLSPAVGSVVRNQDRELPVHIYLFEEVKAGPIGEAAVGILATIIEGLWPPGNQEFLGDLGEKKQILTNHPIDRQSQRMKIPLGIDCSEIWKSRGPGPIHQNCFNRFETSVRTSEIKDITQSLITFPVQPVTGMGRLGHEGSSPVDFFSLTPRVKLK